jgi:hypothetical protein
MQVISFRSGFLVTMLVVLASLIALCLTTGCSFPAKGKIRMGADQVVAPKDAESPSSIKETVTSTTLPIPAGTTITAFPMPDLTTASQSALNSIYWPKDSLLSTQTTVKEATVSPSRKPDQTVELQKLANADRRILLFASIGCLLAGIVVKALVPAWPSLPMGLFAASPILFLAWKFSEIPWWISIIPVLLVCLLVLGYKRAEWDKNGDFIPDAFQKVKKED